MSRFEKPDNYCQHLFLGHALARKIMLYSFSYFRQSLRKGDRAVILGAVSHFSPAGVVAILLASLGIASRRLNVAVCERTNPNIGVSRRNTDRLYPLQLIRIGDRLAVWVEIGEILAGPFAPNSWPGIQHIRQAGDVGRFDRIDRMVEKGSGAAIII